MNKKPLAFVISCTDNLTFAVGNVALSLYKYMPDIDYECVILHNKINSNDLKILKNISKVRMIPFEFPQSFAEKMLKESPSTSRFRSGNALMTFTHFEIFKLLNEYKIVSWLDSDISIQGSIKDIGKFIPFGITIDAPFTVQKNFLKPINNFDMSIPGLCAAIIVVGDQLPFNEIYNWCYKKTLEYASILEQADQGILNLAVQNFNIKPNLMSLEVWQCRPDRPTSITANIVHFGYTKKIWLDHSLCSAFPEWYRMHCEWLKLGGSDFSRDFEPLSAIPFISTANKSDDKISFDNNQLKARLELIETSTSWRITKPFRIFFARFPNSVRIIKFAINLFHKIFLFFLIRRIRLNLFNFRNNKIVNNERINESVEYYDIYIGASHRVKSLYRNEEYLKAANYIINLIEHELWSTSWQLNLTFKIIDACENIEEIFIKSINQQPHNSNFHDILGLINIEKRNLNVAIHHFKSSIKIAPDRVISRLNLAASLYFDKSFSESVSAARAASLFTNDFYAFLILSSAIAARDGNCIEASKNLEKGLSFDKSTVTIDENQDIYGKIILARLTMGAGDLIIALQALENLTKRGAKVWLHIQSTRDISLEVLFNSCPNVSGTLHNSDKFHLNEDFYIDLYRQFLFMGAPKIDIPYLRPPNAEIDIWNKNPVFKQTNSFKVGIVWAGDTNPNWRGFRILSHVQRRCTIDLFNKISTIPQVSLFSLQKGPASFELINSKIPITDLGNKINDYADTAALIANLDLVISVDTSVAHLAGAMGKPVWVLLHYDTLFFFWDKLRSTSWYPSAKLFRQSLPGEWDTLFDEVHNALCELIK